MSDYLMGIIDRGLGEILKEIATAHHCTMTEIVGPSKFAHVSTARREFCNRLRAMGWSYSAIGRLMGRDHTSIIEAVTRRRWANGRHGRVALA